jgi:hypothetical protein
MISKMGIVLKGVGSQGENRSEIAEMCSIRHTKHRYRGKCLLIFQHEF